MREHKKNPGDASKARARHLRRQEIQDAITAVKASAVGDAPVRLRLHQHATLGRCEWDLTPHRVPCDACVAVAAAGAAGNLACTCWDWPTSVAYLVRINGSRLEVCFVYDKDGIKAITRGGTFYVHGGRELLALATPVNDAAKAWA